MKRKTIYVFITLLLIGGLLLSVGCRGEMSKSAYEKRVTEILKEVEEKIKPNLTELEKLSTVKKKERERLEKEQIEILKDAGQKLKRITPPDDFFSGHSNLVEFLDLFVQLKETQTKLPKSAATGSAELEKRQELQEDYQMVTVAFTRASGELSFLQNEMRRAFYDLLRFQSQSSF